MNSLLRFLIKSVPQPVRQFLVGLIMSDLQPGNIQKLQVFQLQERISVSISFIPDKRPVSEKEVPLRFSQISPDNCSSAV